MTATTLPPAPAAHGGTALGTGTGTGHPRHPLGNALRAVRVFVATAVEVVVLGSDVSEGTWGGRGTRDEPGPRRDRAA